MSNTMVSDYIDAVLRKTIVFTPEELLELSNSYVRLTGIHLFELANYFTKLYTRGVKLSNNNITKKKAAEKFLSVHYKKFTLQELTLHNYPNRYKSMFIDWFFKRLGMEWKDAEEIDILLDKFDPDLKNDLINVSESFNSERECISPFFSECMSRDLFEFDIIIITLLNFHCVLADLCLDLSIKLKLFDSFEAFSEAAQLNPDYREDIRFCFDLINNSKNDSEEDSEKKRKNKSRKKMGSVIQNKYKDVIDNVNDGKLIEVLFLLDYNDLSFPILKNHLIRSYLNVFEKKHTEWQEHLIYLVSSYISILLPKKDDFIKELTDRKAVYKEKEAIAKMVNQCLCTIDVYKQLCQLYIKCINIKKQHDEAAEASLLNDTDKCLEVLKDLEQTVKEGIDLDKYPGESFKFDELTNMRENELDTLKGYFSLGSYDNPSEFSLFLQNNLQLIGADIDKVFKDKKTYTALYGVYNRGLMRFFFNFKALCENKVIFDYYCNQCKENKGLSALFTVIHGIPFLNLKSIKLQPYLVTPFMSFRYEPQRKKDNYIIIKKSLFGEKDKIGFIDSVDLEVNQVLPVMMFFYWIYLSLDSKSEKEVGKINQWIFL